MLVGFSGSGKSSVGRELEARTGLPRFDIDEMVCALFGRPIAQIFDAHGEEVFREAESAALREIARAPAIVVTGGGIILRNENIEILERLGKIVYLTAEEETLFERVSRRPTRPLLRTADPRRTLAELLRAREPIYRSLAEIEIDTTLLTHGEVADAILRKIQDER